MQVGSQWWGELPFFPPSPCDPPWVAGQPFAAQMEFVPHPVGKLDMAVSHAVSYYASDSVLLIFAAIEHSQFVLESSSNLIAWTEARRGIATGAMEIIWLPANFTEPSRFFRVRLEQ
ncbi:MAG: hypothetical protein NTW03_05615 [Verrucomicrobia bacterium]|nr:hypothetical protein [Verrucomicrobiota bacterium]